jgi:3-phosphoglycerate kinase
MQGRPKGVTPKFSLAPLVPRLSELLGIQVPFSMTIFKFMLIDFFIYM